MSGMVDRAARWGVLFGEVGGLEYEWDDLDEGERLVLVEDVFGLTGAQGATQVALLSQLLDGEPPFVWETLERLLDAGVGLDVSLGQLRMVLLSTMHDVIAGDDYDDDEYRRRLALLPLPDAGLVDDVLDRLAAERPVAETDELIEAVMAELGGEPDDRMLRMLVERVMEELIMEGFGPLQWLSGGRTVHRRALTGGIVLTHQLAQHERDSERLEVDVDLAGFVGLLDPSLADAGGDDEILMLTDGQWSMSWLGPDGWLDSCPVGSVLAVRVDDEEMVSIEVLAERPAVDPAVVGLLRRVVEEEVDEPGMPVTAADVILGMLAHEPDVFDRPQAPLRQLCQTAGLELRGTEIGDDPELWRNAAQLRRYGRLHERTDDDRELVDAVVGVLDVCEWLALGEDVDSDDVGTALESLADLDVMDLVSEELFRADAGPSPTPEVFASLADTATGRSLASVHTLAAIGAEYDGEPAVDEPGRAWSEHHDLDEDESAIRATFHFNDDGRLEISTNSHERTDRILERLHEAVPVTVVSDTRMPVDLSAGLSGAGELPTGLPDLRRLRGLDGDLPMADIAEQVADQLERRWCDEPVPALGGLTPRDAAADPTRREQVIRLIASFEHQPAPDGAITMRPHRLRALLGL